MSKEKRELSENNSNGGMCVRYLSGNWFHNRR